MKLRIVKYKRFFKPYEIEVSEHKRKYIPLSQSKLATKYQLKSLKFWSVDKAYGFIWKTFLDELDTDSTFTMRIIEKE